MLSRNGKPATLAGVSTCPRMRLDPHAVWPQHLSNIVHAATAGGVRGLFLGGARGQARRMAAKVPLARPCRPALTRFRAVALCGMNDSVVVKVKPGSHKGPLVEVGPTGELTIYVREPAVDGKANEAVTRLLAAHLQLPRSRVELVSGKASRLKRFRVDR